MPLADIVNVTISKQTTGITRVGFGIPMILTYHTAFPELFQKYSKVSDMITPTGPFAADDFAVVLATALKSQTPNVGDFLVGRRTTAPTRSVKLTPIAINDTEYKVTINGESAEFTSDATATVVEITAGLKIAIDALAIANLSTTDNGTDLDVFNTAAGEPFQIFRDSGRETLLAEDETPAGVSSDIPGDLAAIQAANGGNEWYGVTGDWFGELEGIEAAAYIEALEKVHFMGFMDDDALTSSIIDIASVLATNNYFRTAQTYHENPDKGIAAAFLGAGLPSTPGGITWKFQTLGGQATSGINDGEISQLTSKDANFYTDVAGAGVTCNGVMTSGEFIDVTRTVDALVQRLREDVFFLLANAPKVPFTDAGIASVENVVRSALTAFVGSGALDPAFTVTVPLAAAVSVVDRANRLLPDVDFEARLTGAIHAVEINGVVTV